MMSYLLMAILSVALGVGGFFWGRRAFESKRIATHWAITRTRTRASVLFALFGACLPTTLGVDHFLEAVLGEEEKGEVQRMLDLPKVKAHMEGVPPAEKVAALNVLLTQGVGMLPDAVLIDRLKVQAEFLKTLDADLCKHFLIEGKLPNSSAVDRIEKFSPGHGSRWAESKFLALELALAERVPLVGPTQDAVTKAYLACSDTLPKEDRARLTAGLATMAQAPAPEACWLGMKLHEAILLAPPGPQAIMARKLFNP
jgi:hypothetical protein